MRTLRVKVLANGNLFLPIKEMEPSLLGEYSNQIPASMRIRPQRFSLIPSFPAGLKGRIRTSISLKKERGLVRFDELNDPNENNGINV
jgi:hypothetical protein